MTDLSQYMSTGSFIGPFTAITKSVLQDKAFNQELPSGVINKSLYYTAFVFDCFLLMSLLAAVLAFSIFTIKLIGAIF